MARASASRSASSSDARPTIGVSRRRATPRMPAPTSTRRNASTGSTLPFKTSGSTGSATTASRTRLIVGAPIRISPGAAACSRRAATLTASPVTSDRCAAASPATTSPVFTPVRDAIVTPRSRSSSLFREARASRISAAALTARRASSSWTAGIPKTAITASPMYFSTVPPWRSRTTRISSKNRDIRLRSHLDRAARRARSTR